MTRPVLTLRLSRRAIGAAVLSGETLALTDGRHLTSRRDRASVAAARYVQRLLDISKAGRVVLDAPQASIGDTDSVVSAVTSALRERQIEALVIGKSDILTAYGMRPLRTRVEVRHLINGFWPELARLAGKVQPYIMDAAAAALYAESRLALHPPPT